MPHVRLFAAAALAAAAILSCDGRPEPEIAPPSRALFPEVPTDTGSAAAGDPAAAQARELEQPKVPLDPGEKLVRVINANLDLDTNDEQILVLRQAEDSEGPISVAVIDYDTVRSAYVRSWEGTTSATNLRVFDVSLIDLVGDHNLELVCRGIDSQGDQTLDVFRKTPSPNGLGLYFAEICRIVSDGSIEIQEIERSEGYRMGQKNGPSFTIYAYSQDRESGNLLDRIKQTYHWQYQQNRYVLTSVEKQPGAVVEEKQLAELFASTSAEAFERFLSGPWYLSGDKDRKEILMFLPDQRQISIFTGDVVESYIWQASFRSLSNRLTIYAVNEAIESVQKRFIVEVVSLGSIDVYIIGQEQWDRSSGRYIQLTDELQSEILKPPTRQASVSKLNLFGLYRSGDGTTLLFEPPHFTWIGPDSQLEGGFTIFHLDKDVLYLKGLDQQGLPTEDRAYLVDYSEKKESGYLYRTLALTPARLSTRGAEAVSGDRLVFEQLEILEQQQSEEKPSGQ